MATLRQLVKEARIKGIRVSYRIRIGGGINIKSINGQKFTGATGNEILRTTLGVTLTTEKEEHLKSIAPKKGTWGASRIQPKVDKEIRSYLRKVQRIFKLNKVKKDGRITLKNIRYTLTTYGREEAFERLSKAEKYAKGIAYDENVDFLIERLERFNLNESELLKEAINRIKEVKDKGLFKDEFIDKINEEQYKREQIINTDKKSSEREKDKLAKYILQLLRKY